MAGQATGSCQGQQGTGSGSNTLDPWGDYLQRQQFCSANFESSWWAKDFRQPQRTVLEEEVVPLILIKVVFGIRAW